MRILTKILVVNGKNSVRERIISWFKAKGYNAIGAESGMETLKIVSADKPDIILFNLDTAAIDGHETLRRIRKIDKQLPIIVISSRSNSQEIEKVQPYDISGIFYEEGNLEENLPLIELVSKEHKNFDK